MKKTHLRIAVLLSAVILIGTQLAQAATQTFEGIISDSMCEKKHMMPGKTDAQCTEECTKSGSKYVLVANGKTYVLDAKKVTLGAFAGKHVQVQGELKGGTIAVASIQ